MGLSEFSEDDVVHAKQDVLGRAVYGTGALVCVDKSIQICGCHGWES